MSKQSKQMKLTFFGIKRSGSQASVKKAFGKAAQKTDQSGSKPRFGSSAKPKFGSQSSLSKSGSGAGSRPKFGSGATDTQAGSKPKFGMGLANLAQFSAPVEELKQEVVSMQVESDEEVIVVRKRSRKRPMDDDYDPSQEAQADGNNETSKRRKIFGQSSKPDTAKEGGDEMDADEEVSSAAIFSSDASKREKAIAQRMANFQMGAARKSTTKRKSLSELTKEKGKKNHKGEKHKNDVHGEDWFENPRDFSGRKAGEEGYDVTQWKIPPHRMQRFTAGHQVWWETKSKHKDCTIFFKIGKFYELFWDDAFRAHEICGCQWMTADHVPHVGFPESSFDKFVEMLVREGHKVVRVEQMETPAQAKARGFKKGVRRDVCQIVSPGTLTNPNMLGPDEASYLLSVTEKEGFIKYGVVFVDCSTAEFYIGEFEDDRCRSKFRTLLSQIQPREVIWQEGAISAETVSAIKMDLSNVKALFKKYLPQDWWPRGTVAERLAKARYFGDVNPPIVDHAIQGDSLGLDALGGIVNHLRNSLLDVELLSQKKFFHYDPADPTNSQFLVLDGPTLTNLEILVNEMGTEEGSLFNFVNHTCTVFGRRKIREWLIRPLVHVKEIEARLDAVDNLAQIDHVVNDVRDKLKNMPDLKRLLSLVFGNGTKRKMDEATMFCDTLNKRKVEQYMLVIEALGIAHGILDMFQQYKSQLTSKKLLHLTSAGEGYPEFYSLLSDFSAKFDHARAKDEGCIIPIKGSDQDYDHMLAQIDEITAQEQEQMRQIRNHFRDNTIKYKNDKKVRNCVEIKRKTLKKMGAPGSWQAINETKSAISYLSPEQSSWNEDFELLQNQLATMVENYAKEQFTNFSQHRDVWDQVVTCIAELDCLISLHMTSAFAPFQMCRPKFLKGPKQVLKFRDARHPCAHASQVATGGQGDFISNDTVLGTEENEAHFVIVTGPNMGGKSTLLRQTCVNVILAQMGCYVPAQQCELTVVDRIFTRIGANDRILNGQSTFFVELEETSNILRNSTERSLVILDELGRGTSTFDGTAIAYAVARYLAHTVKCRTMFSTHYHLLPKNFENDPAYGMYHMSYYMDKETEDVTFLYKFEKGVCSNSHGINCAKMAGLSESVVKRAAFLSKKFEKDMSARHDNDDDNATKATRPPIKQTFTKLVSALKSGNLDQIRALQLDPVIQQFKESTIAG